MGVVSVPGMSIERRTLRRRGLIAVAVIVVIILVAWLVQKAWPKHETTFTLRTPSVAAGIIPGAPVRIRGLQVGSVASLTRLGNSQQGVTLNVKDEQAKALTNNLQADFSVGNLFGISEVILTPHEGGGPIRNGAEITPTRPITDNTVSNVITTIGDVNAVALEPNASQILLNLDTTSKAMLPLFTTIGSVLQTIQDTQKLSVAQTFPTVANILASVDESFGGALLPSAQQLFANPLVHSEQWVNQTNAFLSGITDPNNSLTNALQKVLDPKAVQGLKTATPLLTNLLVPILTAFPNGSATGVGIQFGQLLNNVRAAMPNTGNGPVLNTRISVDFPAIAAMAPPLPQFQYIPPGNGGRPGVPTPVLPGSAAPAAKPGTATAAQTPSSTPAPAAPSSTATPKPGS